MIGRIVGVVVLGIAAAALPAGQALGATTDWPQYLHDSQHSSVSATTAFTVANASQVHQLWQFAPAAVSGEPTPTLDASPTVVGQRLYIGSNAGVFYALNASTGAVVWQRSLDTSAKLTCAARGITATAAVANDPISGVRMVYAAGARYLYALKAGSGKVAWMTMIGPPDPAGQNANYNWS
jgi:polyvinyl alcohol dehydrogenase (cytochrome)